MHPHRPLVPNRFLELLDNIKLEFESLSHEVNVSKVQRDDYERKRTLFFFLLLFPNLSMTMSSSPNNAR